ncbi:hypothetical protein F4777DRAFT_578209 [Nemania sp. FL0916]|nr:hypothetical protein F4777DRAFT_578209 [Nemania sp. FL0916]
MDTPEVVNEMSASNPREYSSDTVTVESGYHTNYYFILLSRLPDGLHFRDIWDHLKHSMRRIEYIEIYPDAPEGWICVYTKKNLYKALRFLETPLLVRATNMRTCLTVDSRNKHSRVAIRPPQNRNGFLEMLMSMVVTQEFAHLFTPGRGQAPVEVHDTVESTTDPESDDSEVAQEESEPLQNSRAYNSIYDEPGNAPVIAHGTYIPPLVTNGTYNAPVIAHGTYIPPPMTSPSDGAWVPPTPYNSSLSTPFNEAWVPPAPYSPPAPFIETYPGMFFDSQLPRFWGQRYAPDMYHC